MRPPKKLFLACLLTTSFVWAQANKGLAGAGDKKGGEPTINGYVSHADSKKPVLGVVVSITGKGVDKKETLVTDSAGNFKAINISSGEVTIILEKRGFRTLRKEGILIKEGVTLKLNLDLEEEDDNEGISHPLLRMIDGE